MANVLLPNGKVEFVQGASCGSRLTTEVADKMVSIKRKNSGFKDANCIDFGHFVYNFEYGGLSPEKAYSILVQIAKDSFVDLSEIPLIKKVKDIPSEGEYLLMQGTCTEEVFKNYMTPPASIDCDDEEFEKEEWDYEEE